MKRITKPDGTEKYYFKVNEGFSEKWKLVTKRDGKTVDVKTFTGKYPFRKHRLSGGPLDGKIIEVHKNNDFYYPEHEEFGFLRYESNCDGNGNLEYVFRYRGTF